MNLVDYSTTYTFWSPLSLSLGNLRSRSFLSDELRNEQFVGGFGDLRVVGCGGDEIGHFDDESFVAAGRKIEQLALYSLLPAASRNVLPNS